MDAETEQLRTKRSRTRTGLRTIVERLADGILVLDRAGAIRFANPAAEELFGRPARELVGEQFGFPVVSSETTEIDVVRRGGGVVTAELRAVDTDWEGEPALVVSLRDITERKQAEERERQLVLERAGRAEAEAASRAKSEFLAVMSHELRTPLNAILGYAELLDLGLAGPLTAEQRQQLSRIAASGRHLLGLVNEVLDLAKVESGRLTIEHAAYNAAETARAAIILVQPQAEAKGVALTVTPQEGEGPLYVGDEDRVRQILLNLLSNAVKFTDAGGRVSLVVESTPTPDPEARLHGSECYTCLRVSDTGIGIASDQLDAVFAPFVQAQMGHTRRKDGTGLGLTISRRLARLMGGDLTVRSTVGRGSTFALWLPAPSPGRSQEGGHPRARLAGHEPRVQGLADVGESLMRELEPILDAFVARLRADPLTPLAHGLRFSQLADHVGTLMSDIAATLIVLEESAGQPSPILADSADLQRLIAERHGAQRAQLGWSVAALRREHALRLEEVEGSMRRCFLGDTSGRIPEAMAVIRRMIDQAEALSARSMELAQQRG